jgi:hypothetical protein
MEVSLASTFFIGLDNGKYVERLRVSGSKTFDDPIYLALGAADLENI